MEKHTTRNKSDVVLLAVILPGSGIQAQCIVNIVNITENICTLKVSKRRKIFVVPISTNISIFIECAFPSVLWRGKKNEFQIMKWNKQKDSMKANVDKYFLIA